MENQHHLIYLLLLTFTTLLTTPFAYSKDSNDGFIIVGPASTAEYQGSDDYSLVPMIISQFNVLGTDFEVEGLTFRGGLFQNKRWTIGATVDLDMGRDDSIENTRIALFEEIDFGLNVGPFIGFTQSDVFTSGDSLLYRLSLFVDGADAHDGFYTTGEISYTFPLFIPWRVELELTSTYANDDYMMTYFGVSQTDSQLSGIPEFSAESSMRDVSLNANIGFFTSPKWGAFFRVGFTKLVGEAKKSPIVLNGNDSQYFAGVGVFYRFGGE